MFLLVHYWNLCVSRTLQCSRSLGNNEEQDRPRGVCSPSLCSFMLCGAHPGVSLSVHPVSPRPGLPDTDSMRIEYSECGYKRVPLRMSLGPHSGVRNDFSLQQQTEPLMFISPRKSGLWPMEFSFSRTRFPTVGEGARVHTDTQCALSAASLPSSLFCS